MKNVRPDELTVLVDKEKQMQIARDSDLLTMGIVSEGEEEEEAGSDGGDSSNESSQDGGSN